MELHKIDSDNESQNLSHQDAAEESTKQRGTGSFRAANTMGDFGGGRRLVIDHGEMEEEVASCKSV